MFPFAQSDALNGAQADSKTNTFKVKLTFFWIGAQSVEAATGAQLIVYPQYPEVRLSGFLRGCKTAPNDLMQPPTKGVRKFNNASDGRVLLFGITQDGRTLAYLAAADSAVANECFSRYIPASVATASIFYKLSLIEESTKVQLLRALSQIHLAGSLNLVKLIDTGLL